MFAAKPLKRFLLASGVMLSVLAGTAKEASAQLPWGYSPLTGSNSWLWLSRSLFSPSSLLFRGGYGYNAPYYLVNTLAWNGTYAASQAINYAGKKAQAKKYWSNPQNGVNAPAVDQISVAPWYHPSAAPTQAIQPASTFQPNLIADPAFGTQETEFMPVPQALDGTAANTGPNIEAPPSPTKNDLPLAAPDFRSASSAAAANTQAPATNSKSPFTQAFVDHVNSNFDGDIGKALKDKQTRAYAQALGIIDFESKKEMELPTDRIELIKRILNDQNEDSISKINAIRLLIKH